MRTINSKLFLGLLIGTFSVVGAAFALHAFQKGRISQALLWQARRADDEGKTDRAITMRQRYLEFNPTDTEEKINLARSLASEDYPRGSRSHREAVRLLDQILLQEDNPELRILLIKTALGNQDFQVAKTHLERLRNWKDLEADINQFNNSLARGENIVLPENMQRGELDGYWGQILEQEREFELAITCYRRAVILAPELIPNYVRLANLLRRQIETDPERRSKLYQEADQIIDQLVAKHDTSFEAHLARWRYRRDFDLLAIRETAFKGQVELEQAAEDVVQALKRKPNSVDVLLAAADLERLRARSAAEDVERTPEQRLAALKQHRGKALEYLSRGLDLISRKEATGVQGEFQLLWHKANLLLDDLDMQRTQMSQQPAPDDRLLKEEIAQLIERVRKSQMPAAADYMRGRLLIHERQWAEAALLFERARAELASQEDLACQANLYLGQCYERLEDYTQMYNAYRRAADFDPNSVPALLGMAAARWAQGNLDQALSQFEIIMKQKRVPPRGWIDIARLEIQRQLQRSKPEWRLAEQALDNAEKYFPNGDLDLTLLRAELLVRQNRSTDARRVLEASRDKHPKEIEYWTGLIDLALRRKEIKQAAQLLDQATTAAGDQANLRLARARYLAAAEGKQSVKAILQLALNRERFNEEDQSRLVAGLADILYRLEAVAAARQLWDALLQLPKHKTDLRLRMLLFDVAMKESDEAGMKKMLDEIRQIEQTSGVHHNYGQSLMLLWQARRSQDVDRRAEFLREARQRLDQVLTQRPSWAAAFVARAEINELIGNPEQAIKDLQEARRHGDNSPSVVRRLVSLLTQRGRDGEAQLELGKLSASALDNSDLGRLAVLLSIRRGKEEEALDMARKMVNEDSKNIQELIWMARVLATANKPAEAEKKLRQAIAVAESNPEAWFALVQFLQSQQRSEEAKAAIEEAKKKLDATKAAVTLARCHDLVGQPSQARKYLQQAIKDNDNNPLVIKEVAAAHLVASRSLDAEPLLRRLAYGEWPNAPTSDVLWARRALALVLASGTDYQRFTEALDLVGLKLDDRGRLLPEQARETSTENLRTQARVLASQNQKQFRLRAIQLLEDLSRSRALLPDDEFLLANLYAANGEAAKSEEKLRELTQSQTRSPQYLAQYAMQLIQQQRLPTSLDEAEKIIALIQQLEKQRQLEANTYASVELRARLLEARKKGDEALDLLRSHIARDGARPEEIIMVLGSMTRQKRYAEAFELCEQLWKENKCKPEVLSGISVSLLRAMQPTDAQVRIMLKHIREAITRKPDSIVLLMHLADLYDKQGQYAKAEEQYRQILKREPNNVVALNNLAWMLAQRSGNGREALEFINKAVAGIGRRADLIDTRGLVYLALKDVARAQADFEEAVSDGPSPVRLFHLAWAQHENRDRKRAEATLRQAKEKGLELTQLHPIEQETAQQLLQYYGIR